MSKTTSFCSASHSYTYFLTSSLAYAWAIVLSIKVITVAFYLVLILRQNYIFSDTYIKHFDDLLPTSSTKVRNIVQASVQLQKAKVKKM